MTENPSEPGASEVEASEDHPLSSYAATIAATVGGVSHTVAFDTIKIKVEPERWTEALHAAKHDAGLVHFSYLSAIDWSNEVEVGDAPSDPVEERFEILAAVADLTDGHIVHLSADLSKENASIQSATGVFAGAGWHEREANEMFGIDFPGNENLENLYLPTEFEGHPMKKSYPLLAREVKPWPGTVDVEGMPEQDEEEAAATTTPAGATTENPGR